MARRLATEAKIILERAGYTVRGMPHSNRAKYFAIGETPAVLLHNLMIEGGTVDNAELVALLAERDCDERGYQK